MTISERIVELIKERGMSQKEFSLRTGIAQSCISDWKRKKTNPVSDKILIICEVLDVSPYELLSGTESVGSRSNRADTMVVDMNSELGEFIINFQSLKLSSQAKLIGYMQALQDMELNTFTN